MPGAIIPPPTLSSGTALTLADKAEAWTRTIVGFAQQRALDQLQIVSDIKTSILNQLVPPLIDYTQQGVENPPFIDSRTTISRPTSPSPVIAGVDPIPPHDDYVTISEHIPDVPTFPAYTVPDISIVDPTKPLPLDVTFDEDVPVLDYPIIPVAPDPTYPDVVEMTPVVWSTMPELNFPSFDGIRPTFELISPQIFITSGDNDYQTSLLDAIKVKLENDVINGGTGLGAEIENDIWERNQERDALALSDILEKTTNEWVARGFDYPNGMLNGMLMPLEVEYMHKRTDTSRDIAIKQAELAQANTHFAIEQSKALEQILINWANLVADRTFEASKAYTQALLAGFEAEMKKQSLLLDQYKTDASVFSELLKAELTKLEKYKIEAEVNKTISEFDKNRVDSYKEQVNAIDTMIKSYAQEVEAAKVIAEIQKIRMEAFKSAVEAYVARVNAKTAEYGMYTSEWNGEKIKAEVFSTRVQAYSERVKSLQIETDLKIDVMKGYIEANKDMIARYVTDADVYKIKTANEIAAVEERLKLFSSEVSRYQVDATVYNTQAEIDIKKYDAEIQKAMKRADLLIREAELQLKADEYNKTLSVETLKSVATVAAHIVAGAMASIHAGATMSSSGSASDNLSNQNQSSQSVSYEVRNSYAISEGT